MITIKNNNDTEMKNIIHYKLRKNNIDKCKWFKEYFSDNISKDSITQINFLAFDNEKLVGGAIGFIEYNWYYLDLLFVDEQFRGKDIGTNLIRSIEEYAKQKSLTGVRTETWDFQAKEFYEKMGYKLFGEINDCPPGTICYSFCKYVSSL